MRFVRPFEFDDLDSFVPNEWSTPADFMQYLRSPHYKKHTVDMNGIIQAITVFGQYAPNCYEVCVLISSEIQPRAAAIVKRFFYEEAERLKAERVQTHSVACDILDEWHKYLGFTPEGYHRKMAHGRNFRTWGIVWDGKH